MVQFVGPPGTLLCGTHYHQKTKKTYNYKTETTQIAMQRKRLGQCVRLCPKEAGFVPPTHTK